MIVVKNLGQDYPRHPGALKSLDFEVQSGEMVYLTGPSGAGKTTLLRLIALIERPSRGQIHVGDLDLGRLSPRDIPYYRRRVGFISQTPTLLATDTVADNIALPLRVLGLDPAEVAHRVQAALEKVSLKHKAQALAGTLSTGEQQRIGIARAIVHRPAILLADEPTANLDPPLARDMMQLLERFRQAGVCVIVATHDVNLIHAIPQRTLVLNHGALIKDTAVEELL